MAWPNVWWWMGWQQNLFFPLYFHIYPPCFYSWRWRTAQTLVVTFFSPHCLCSCVCVRVRACAFLTVSDWRNWKMKVLYCALLLAHYQNTPSHSFKLGFGRPLLVICTSTSFKSSGNAVWPGEQFPMFFNLKHAKKEILSVKLWRSC